MDIAYRRLSDKDLDTFISMRINQLREEGAKEDIDLRPALKDYYLRHIADGTFFSWIALDNDKIIGTELGIVIDSSSEHPLKANFPILVTEFGIVIEVRLSQ